MPTAALILAQDLRFASLACELTHKFAIRLNLQLTALKTIQFKGLSEEGYTGSHQLGYSDQRNIF